MTNTYMFDFSIVIPCRNEEDYISKMLWDVANQVAFRNRPGEIIIVDGMSTDCTISKIQAFKSTANVKIIVLENPRRHVADGLNAAISLAQGEFIVRMDVHARYPVSYVDTLLSYITEHPNCGNVGVPWRTLPASSSAKAIAIATVLSHPFGIGNAKYRIGNISTPQNVDTVPFGCFRANLFDEIGSFDTELIRNQDDEMNCRIVKAGYDITLLPEPEIEYFGRDTYKKLWLMYYQYGLFKPLAAKKAGGVATARQLVPAAMVAGLYSLLILSFVSPFFLIFYAFIIVMYFAAGLIASRGILRAKRDENLPRHSTFFKLWLSCVAAFAIVHLAYGHGFLKGLYLLIGRRRVVISSSSR